jgi:hypothetical protein
LCLLILSHIIDEPIAQNSIHDAQMGTSVPLFKPATLHKNATFLTNRPALPLSETLLELLTDFCTYHLLPKFPFEHYQ